MSIHGYVVNLADAKYMENCMSHGIYGPLTSKSKGGFAGGTALPNLADLLSMKAGDLLFFFSKRNIYGIGCIKRFDSNQSSPVLCNFPKSYELQRVAPQDESHYLWPPNEWHPSLNNKDSREIRWIVPFEPFPSFFTQGIDMDDFLQFEDAKSIRQLRFFSDVTFIKMESRETQLLLDMFTRRVERESVPLFGHDSLETSHSRITRLLKKRDYFIDLSAFAVAELQRKKSVSKIPESSLRALVSLYVSSMSSSDSVFGKTDSVFVEYPASPVKPRIWSDRIDILLIETNRILNQAPETIVRYKIIELKVPCVDLEMRDSVERLDESPPPVAQLMKYVDWLAREKAGGDYSMIEAYLVASDFQGDWKKAKETTTRHFQIPRRPYNTEVWNSIHLIKFEITNDKGFSLREYNP